MSWLKRILLEPLLHFLVLGALVFGLYSGLHWGDNAVSSGQRVYIDEAEVQRLSSVWQLQWQRPPTAEELRGLTISSLKEELFSREARALGLAENDIIIRRRLAQKLTFLVQDTADLLEPTEAELHQFYTTHPALFQTAAKVSLRQIYFNPANYADPDAAAQQGLTQLATSGSAWSGLGDPSPLETTLTQVDQLTLTNQFGRQFAQAVMTLSPGEWQGPIESAFGLHLVQVLAVQPQQLQPFAEVRARVVERWRDQRQRENDEALFARLLQKYDVTIAEGVKPLIGPLDPDSLAQNLSHEGANSS